MTTDTAGFPADTPDAPEGGRRRRMTWKKGLAVGLAAVVVLGGAGAGTFVLLGSGEADAADTLSRTAEVERGTQTLSVSLDATLSPQKESEVNFAVSGTVTKVKVEAGDTVKKGQKLAVVDDSDLQNAVDLAEADLTTARANRTDVYDNDDSSTAAKRSATAQVTSAVAALASAEDDLDDAALRSPIAGTVASVNVEVGDSTASTSSSEAGSAPFVIIATAKWKVEGEIGAADLSSVKAGQEATITTDATTDELTGTVSSVGIVATSTSEDGTATFPVEITLKGRHSDLYSGTTATAVITVGSYEDVLTVPTAAVRTENDTTVVTTVADGTNSTVEVEVGMVFGSYTEITSGLNEGDSVLITITRPDPTSTASGEEDSGLFGSGPPAGGGGMDGGGPPAGGGTGGR